MIEITDAEREFQTKNKHHKNSPLMLLVWGPIWQSSKHGTECNEVQIQTFCSNELLLNCVVIDFMTGFAVVVPVEALPWTLSHINLHTGTYLKFYFEKQTKNSLMSKKVIFQQKLQSDLC